MLLWSIEPKIALLPTIESKNQVAIMIVSNSDSYPFESPSPFMSSSSSRRFSLSLDFMKGNFLLKAIFCPLERPPPPPPPCRFMVAVPPPPARSRLELLLLELNTSRLLGLYAGLVHWSNLIS